MRFARDFAWLQRAMQTSRGGQSSVTTMPDVCVLTMELPALDRLREPPVGVTPGGIPDNLTVTLQNNTGPLFSTNLPPENWWIPWASLSTNDAVARTGGIRLGNNVSGANVDVAPRVLIVANGARVVLPRPVILTPGSNMVGEVNALTAGNFITMQVEYWRLPPGEKPPWM